MGFLDGIRAMVEPLPTIPQHSPFVERSESSFDTLVAALNTIIAERQQAFTLTQARKLPPVIRGVGLIAGVGASMLPLVYQRGQAMEVQPRIVRKPDPFNTRYQFIYQTIDALVASDYGEAFWLLTDHDTRMHPRSAMVLPNSEVRVEWDERQFLPRYFWRDKPLIRDVEIKHIAPNRRPGELHGHGPLKDALDYLYPVHEAEMYASSFFSSGGLPLTVLKTAANLDKEQAAKLKQQWVEQRASALGGAEPAVAGGGLDVDFPGVDPQKSQMTEARGAGAAIVSRVLGIPATLLHSETHGATIVYQNAEGALEELVKTTIAPMYLAPIEQAWSELVPSPQSIRFDLADMQRASVGARISMYAQAIGTTDPKTGEPLMTVEEARAHEGWAPSGQDSAHGFDPEPVPEPATVEVPHA